jgi:drug/metabolite transporter (DMT)-like permease
MIPSWLWIVFTLCGSAGQVARNAMQRSLTASLGTVGATHVRFLFGFPFALIFLGIAMAVTGSPLPQTETSFWPWLLLGGLTQVGATALMLAAMEERSFVVATAFIKTEPIQLAIFTLLFLGETVTPLKMTAIVIATLGVIIMAIQPGKASGMLSMRSTLLGLGAAAMFALSSVGYRGALLAVDSPSFIVGASYTLVLTLLMQTIILTVWLWFRDRKVLFDIFRLWRPSISAGFMGALASQFWFMAFSLTSPANVRTLALVEVLFAQGVSYYSFKQRISPREILGIVLIVIGVGVLVAVH